MKEQEVTMKVVRAEILDIEGARDLQDWCEKQPGLYCRITSHVAGGYRVEVGGVTSDEKSVSFGDTVSWDGSQFSVTSPE